MTDMLRVGPRGRISAFTRWEEVRTLSLTPHCEKKVGLHKPSSTFKFPHTFILDFQVYRNLLAKALSVSLCYGYAD